MGSFDIQDKDVETVRNALINHMGAVHKMVDDGTQLFFERYRRKTYVTPRSYLGFIGTRRHQRPAASLLLPALTSGGPVRMHCALAAAAPHSSVAG